MLFSFVTASVSSGFDASRHVFWGGRLSPKEIHEEDEKRLPLSVNLFAILFYYLAVFVVLLFRKLGWRLISLVGCSSCLRLYYVRLFNGDITN